MSTDTQYNWRMELADRIATERKHGPEDADHYDIAIELPYLPPNMGLALTGTVNREPACGVGAEMILIRAFTQVRDGETIMHVSVRRRVPWGYSYRYPIQDGSEPEQVVDDDGKPLYEAADFDQILDREAWPAMSDSFIDNLKAIRRAIRETFAIRMPDSTPSRPLAGCEGREGQDGHAEPNRTDAPEQHGSWRDRPPML